MAGSLTVEGLRHLRKRGRGYPWGTEGMSLLYYSSMGGAGNLEGWRVGKCGRCIFAPISRIEHMG